STTARKERTLEAELRQSLEIYINKVTKQLYKQTPSPTNIQEAKRIL
ncbi:33568_t:CDS:1, partial [Racocetra persica]